MTTTHRTHRTDNLSAMLRDAEAVKSAALEWTSSHWDEGQSRWTGGDGNDAPAKHVSAAFDAMRAAIKAADEAILQITFQLIEQVE